ncbi:hypothetical protein GCM10010129_11230 [Streptomyces fumigatiscleroticus]|nr:hypothetical protein GCM10010129_11230 [Streptomyces fumigatiscleroticus]
MATGREVPYDDRARSVPYERLDEEPRVRRPLRLLGRWTAAALSAVCVAVLYYIVLTRGRAL